MPCSGTTSTIGECATMIRRTAQQIAEAAEAVAGVTDDTAVERWVRLVVAQVAEVAAALGVSMLHHPGRRSAEEYGRRLDEAIEAGGIFGCVQIAGERIARALDEVAGGIESVNHATALRELWSIVETLEVYGWSNYFPSSRGPRAIPARVCVDHHEQGADE